MMPHDFDLGLAVRVSLIENSGAFLAVGSGGRGEFVLWSNPNDPGLRKDEKPPKQKVPDEARRSRGNFAERWGHARAN